MFGPFSRNRRAGGQKERARSRSLFFEPLESRRLLAVYVVDRELYCYDPPWNSICEYVGQSLAEAAEKANNHPGTDTIRFAETGWEHNYILGGTGHFTESVTIEGSREQLFTGGRLFSFGGPGENTYTINGLRSSRGSIPDDLEFDSGGIELIDEDDTLIINNSVIGDNDATMGGGIYALGGTLNINQSIIKDNFAENGGGGIYAKNTTVTIRDSVISGNWAPASQFSASTGPGGGLWIEGGTLHMSNSTVADNSASSAGGLLLGNVQATLINTTVTGNVGAAAIYGSGAIHTNGGRLAIINSTIAYNGVFNGQAVVAGGVIEYQNSIFVENEGNFRGPESNLISLGHNIADDNTGNLTAAGDMPNTDPLIEEELTDNGGPTPTLALLPGSPAIDAGTDLSGQGITADQRGVARPYGFGYDIGAFEAQFDFDYGDAPDDLSTPRYPTLRANAGARHVVGSLYLGAEVDFESDGQPTDEADGDDNQGADDDDGVILIADLVATAGEATTASFEITASDVGQLDAWIDFNHNDLFDHPDEHLGGGNSIGLVAGSQIIPFTVPAGAEAGPAFARFRISAGGGLLPSGVANDGEVEDYLLTILDGDAPGGANPVIHLPEFDLPVPDQRNLAFEFQRTVDTVTDAVETITFSQSFSRPPLLLAGMQTFDEADTAGLRYQNLTADSVQLFVEEETSEDLETTHTAEKVGFAAIGRHGTLVGQTDPALGRRVIGEAGQVEQLTAPASTDLSRDWQTVTLANTYAHPVVIAKPPSFNDTDPVMMHLRNVTSNSFDIAIGEWYWKRTVEHGLTLNGGSHAAETASYLVIETGTHRLPDGTLIHAGTVDVDQNFSAVSFPAVFDTTPVVLSHSQTRNELLPVVTRQRNVTANGFEVRIQKEERWGGSYATQTVGYIAVEVATGVVETRVSGYLEAQQADAHIFATLDGIALFDAPEVAVESLHIVGTTRDDAFGVRRMSGEAEVRLIFNGRAGEDTLRLTSFDQVIDLTTSGNLQLAQLERIDLTGSGANTLTVDAQSVVDVTDDANVLAVKCGIDETINLGEGWSISGTQVMNGEFYRVIEQDDAMLLLNGPASWQNPLDPLDIDASDSKEPRDVLLIINQLNDRRYADSVGQLTDPAHVTFPGFYYDTSGDGFLSPLDALLFINFLNAHGGQMEGEASADNLSAAGIQHALAIGRAGNFAIQFGEDKLGSTGKAEVLGRPDDNRPAVNLASSSDQREFTVAVDRLFAHGDDLLEATEPAAWMSLIELLDYRVWWPGGFSASIK